MIETKDLSFWAGDTHEQLLKGVSLRIRQGEKVGIIGASGSGKTTLCSASF
jgi:energy-coupling factor transport system ATP-binding protein